VRRLRHRRPLQGRLAEAVSSLTPPPDDEQRRHRRTEGTAPEVLCECLVDPPLSANRCCLRIVQRPPWRANVARGVGDMARLAALWPLNDGSKASATKPRAGFVVNVIRPTAESEAITRAGGLPARSRNPAPCDRCAIENSRRAARDAEHRYRYSGAFRPASLARRVEISRRCAGLLLVKRRGRDSNPRAA
jgi:hypothetical protein